jgi:peroxiredoxin
LKKTPLILGIVAAAALAAGIAWYSSHRTGSPRRDGGQAAAPEPAGRRTVPPFTLADINGNMVDSSRFAGKPTVVNFFATWCPPCREEIPGFVAVYDKYKDRGLEIVGISLDTDTRGNLPGFIMNNRIGYRILLGNPATVRAFGGGSAIPATFFIGRDGEIRYVHVGYMDRDAFDREVRKLL